MNIQLKHIFDQSACLNRKQLRNYLEGNMNSEECHAVEHHLNGCPFCSEAVDGLSIAEARNVIDELNTNFLNEHFHSITPQVHLNSMAPAQPLIQKQYKGKTPPVLRTTSIAVIVLISIGAIWYVEFGRDRIVPNQLKQATVLKISESDKTDESSAPAASSSTPVVAAKANIAVTKTSIKKRKERIDGSNRNDNDPQQQKVPPLILTSKANKVATGDDSSYPTEGIKNKDIKPEKKVSPTSYTSTAATNTDKLEQGKALYQKQSYTAALGNFRQAMKSDDVSDRQEATLMAAQCYYNLGQKEEAEKLLHSIIQEGGHNKKTAKKMLRHFKKF